MTPELMSAIRSILIAIGGFAVGRGWIDEPGLEALIGGMLTIGVTLWGIYAKRPQAGEAQQVAEKVATARQEAAKEEF